MTKTRSAAILRELREELQLEAEVTRVLLAAKNAPNHVDLAFLCQAKGAIGNLSHELLDYAWVNRKELPAIKSFHRRSIEAADE